MNNDEDKTKQAIIFPKETVPLIGELVEKYQLKKLEREISGKMRKTKTLEEKRKLFENLPVRQISRILREVAEGEILIRAMPTRLQKALNIPEKTAQVLTKDIKERIIDELGLIEKGKLEILEKPEPPPKKKPPQGDIYREPIK